MDDAEHKVERARKRIKRWRDWADSASESNTIFSRRDDINSMLAAVSAGQTAFILRVCANELEKELSD